MDAHGRGARLHVPRALRQPGGRGSSRAALRRRSGDGAVARLGGVAFTEEDERRHFKLIGTTGTGKSTAIAELLRVALGRGDRALIADPGGAYLDRFFDRYRGDVALNPFERQSVRWDPFMELRRAFDAEELARSLIAERGDAASREWRAYARTFIAAVFRRCDENGRRDLQELWRILATADTSEVRRTVAGTPAQPFLDPDNARMFASIRAVAISALAALQHVAAQRGRAFSVRDWISVGRGALFIPYRASQISALRTLISTWVRLAIFETLNGPEISRGPAQSTGGRDRIWFVVDELDALGAIDGLEDALVRLRKRGGRCVLGFQSIAQVRGTYGDTEAQTIIENCGNTLILRCSASERGGTSAYASRLIGDREVIRRQVSRSRGDGLFAHRRDRRTTQISHQRVTEAAVLPAELEQLPDLTGWLKTASTPCWTLIRLKPDARPWPSIFWG